MPRRAPYGTWASPLSLDLLVEKTVGVSFPIATTHHIYWTEARPAEGGRLVLVRAPAGGGEAHDVFGPDFNARTLVHEYGGLCAAVSGDTVFFSNFADQRLYRVDPGHEPRPITPEPPSPCAVRFAAPVVTPDGRYVLAVRERHGDPDVPSTVVNDVVVVPTSGDAPPRAVAGGHDFYSHPVVSPDGRRMSWVSWDHPNMPWDGTELWEAELDTSGGFELRHERRVAGGPSESVIQPKYTPQGELVYISDRTGWWNLYAAALDGGTDRPLAPMQADLGAPDWVFGTSSYAVLADGTILAAWSQDGLSHVGTLAPRADAFDEIPSTWTAFAQLRTAGDGRSAVAVAGSASAPPSIVRITPGVPGGEQVVVVKRARERVVDAAYLSEPEPIEFPTERGARAHALFYAPKNPDVDAPIDELPPLIVGIHGGPTSAASAVLNYGIQFWTSRGFAVVDVNYGGSTGYGRAYRERLRGAWGVVDLEDCVNAARHLVESGRVDGDRLLIHGGSAGGYTTLCALTFTDMFAAGASYFGVADAVVFAQTTHKFESRYVDGLFGPWPEAEDVYRARSPAFHTEQLRTPLIVFQGLEDKVVPPDQAEIIVAALSEKGVPHAYVAYEGEQHGFRRAETVRRTAEAELYFYGRVLGFEPADRLEPVEIVHEDRLGT